MDQNALFYSQNVALIKSYQMIYRNYSSCSTIRIFIKDYFCKRFCFCDWVWKSWNIPHSLYIYLLVKFRKLVLAIFILHYGLQTLTVSGDLETIDVIVVEIPWNTPDSKKNNLRRRKASCFLKNVLSEMNLWISHVVDLYIFEKKERNMNEHLHFILINWSFCIIPFSERKGYRAAKMHKVCLFVPSNQNLACY